MGGTGGRVGISGAEEETTPDLAGSVDRFKTCWTSAVVDLNVANKIK